MKVIICCLIFLIFSFKNIQSIDECFGQKWLDENYLFKWKTNHLEKVITIRVEVMTKGWVGFGLSKHGKTNEVDMAIGWVDNFGNCSFKDFWINEHGNRSLDMSQDWTLLSAEENATHTILEFKRSYDTCDVLNDLVIYENEIELSNILFAYSLLDASSDHDIPEPIFKGIYHLNFFEMQVNEPKENDQEIVDNWLNKTLSPQTENSYCILLKDDFLKNRTSQIVKFQITAEPSFEEMKINHHFAWFNCNESFNFEKSSNIIFSCYDSNNSLFAIRKKCFTPEIVTVLNTEPLIFPANVGLTLDNVSKYFLLEGHFKNPSNKFVDAKFSIRIWLTKQIRKYKASIVSIGAAYGILYNNWGFIVPPKQNVFKISSIVSSYCFENDNFEETGIFIFQTFFHSHHAKRLEIRHYRNDKLIRVIPYNQYDDEFQPYRPIRPHINLRKSDKLLTICDYNSMNETKSYSGPHEHCVMEAFYYPASIFKDERVRTSHLPYEKMLKITGLEQIDGYDTELLENVLIRKPFEYNNTKLIDFISENKYKMNDPKELEEFQISADMMECCSYVPDNLYTKNKPCRVIKKPPGLYQSIKSNSNVNTCQLT